MMPRARVLLLGLLAACSSSSSVAMDAGLPSSGASDAQLVDAQLVDASEPDATVVTADAGLGCALPQLVGVRCASGGNSQCVEGELVCIASLGAPAPFTETLTVAREDMSSGVPQGAGVALGELSGDGRLDVVVGGPDGLHILFGDGQGGFAEADSASVPTSTSPAFGVVLVDFDGDADLDIFASYPLPHGALRLFENNGTGAFVDISAEVGLPAHSDPAGSAWADFDGDGDLDVAIAGYHAAPTLLLRNMNGSHFEDATALLLPDSAMRPALQPQWFDYDNDGDVDLFISSDFGPTWGYSSTMYRNDGGTFSDVTKEMGLGERFFAMGTALGDLNHDGMLDLFVTNIGWHALAADQRLFESTLAGTYSENAGLWNAAVPTRWGWGTELFDYDNDRDLDLAIAAGKNTSSWFGENLGSHFLEITGVAGGLPPVGERAYGLATGDFDQDGRLDLVFQVNTGPSILRGYRNTSESPGGWVEIALSGTGKNRYGIGATIYVYSGGEVQMRAITAGSSYLSSSEPVAHFGLGDHTRIDLVKVRWPNGEMRSYLGSEISIGERITLAQ